MVDGGKEALQDVETDQKVTGSKQDKGKKEQEESEPEKKESKVKSKQTTVESDDESKSGDQSQDRDDTSKIGTEEPKAHSWQAVWDASRGAWYFWNAETQETTWENPLTSGKGKEENVKATSVSTTSMTDAEIAEMCGIDPDLAYLDPAMYAKEIHQARIANKGSGTSLSSSAYRVAGRFDRRTGKFISQPQHIPSSSSPGNIHHRQADRQLNAFFDVNEFEQKRKREHQQSSSHQETDEQGRIKRQRPTKKEVKFFKERAKEKKASKHAWLRN